MMSRRVRDAGGYFHDLGQFIDDGEVSVRTAFVIGFVRVNYDFLLWIMNINASIYLVRCEKQTKKTVPFVPLQSSKELPEQNKMNFQNIMTSDMSPE